MRTSFVLTAALVAANTSPVVCLAPSAIGRTHRLYAERPGAELNQAVRATIAEPNGDLSTFDTTDEPPPALIVVPVSGVLEQRAGYHDMCAGWTDGHDALTERMIMALEQADVLMVFDSPGGAAAGLEEAVRRVVEAKEAFGRRVTGFVDEECGSAAYWWAACVCDEIYAPRAGVTGSIGARSAHGSIAGALKKEGVEVTYFAWPNEGKIAFAPELPLSDLGRERGERDVSLAGEAFAAAVGPRRGLSRDEIVALSADALSGKAAVSAKLIDGIATYEEVLDYCTALGSGVEPGESGENGENGMSTATNSKMMPVTAVSVRAEDDPDKKPEESGEQERTGLEPDGVCKTCGHQNENDSKYCDQCGETMEAKPLESEDDEPDQESATESPDEDASSEPAKPGERRSAQPAPEKDERAAQTMNQILGLRPNASALAQKTAVLRMRDVMAQCMTATRTKTMDAMLGAVIAHASDATRVAKLEEQTRAFAKRDAHQKRMALLNKLAAGKLPGYSRGELFVDLVNEDGSRRGVRPVKMYAEMRLATLEEFVASKLKGAAKTARTTPFEASRAEAEHAEAAGRTEIASSLSYVKEAQDRSSASAEQIARTAAELEKQWAVQN